MAEDFPTEFDVVVIGTGLPESILAAAFSRIGQKVLHIDRNGYYSGRWCSFNLQGVDSWLKQTQGEDVLQTPSSETVNSHITEGETTIDLQLEDASYSNVNIKFHIGDEDTEQGADKTSDCLCSSNLSQEGVNSKQQVGNQGYDGFNNQDKVSEQESGASSESGNKTVDRSQLESENCNQQESEIHEGESCTETEFNKNKEKWTKSRLQKEWRKFNLDLTPKLLYCGGSMVQLLITSDIAKYCEFKTVTRMLTLLDGKLEKVPCSRADVFNSKEVSMLEKRMLMKFLTSCAEYDKNPSDYQAFVDKPFIEYLESKKLTKTIKHFVQHSIAMATSQTLTTEGLARTKKFLHSLGRYGNTAFLWPLYGCGELPQSFCRMCAVFGGVYCLKMSASHLVINKDKQCTGVVTTDGKKISAKYVIIEESSVPSSCFNASNKRYISRAVLVTDRSILPDQSQQLSLLQFPDKDGQYISTVIELPPSSMASPSPLNVVHVTKETEAGDTTPEADLQDVVTSLFQEEPSSDVDKPVIMWSLYFKREFYNKATVDGDTIPGNVIVIPGPGPQLDIDCVVDQTKDIFERLMPGEDFLPRPPNPEDIIYIDDAENTVPNDMNQSDFINADSDQSEIKEKLVNQSQSYNSCESDTAFKSEDTASDIVNQSESDNTPVDHSESVSCPVDKSESVSCPVGQSESVSCSVDQSSGPEPSQ